MPGSPDEIQGVMEVDLDTPGPSPISLGRMDLKAVVGTARLHTPSNLDVSTVNTSGCEGKEGGSDVLILAGRLLGFSHITVTVITCLYKIFIRCGVHFRFS